MNLSAKLRAILEAEKEGLEAKVGPGPGGSGPTVRFQKIRI